MNKKRFLIVTLFLLIILNLQSFASVRKVRNSVFIGEVKTVEYNEKDNNLKLTANGYVKGCEMYKQELIAIVNEETILLPSECPKEGEEPKFRKVDPKDTSVKKGEIVFIVLDEAMAQSNPPQVVAKAIQFSK